MYFVTCARDHFQKKFSEWLHSVYQWYNRHIGAVFCITDKYIFQKQKCQCIYVFIVFVFLIYILKTTKKNFYLTASGLITFSDHGKALMRRLSITCLKSGT